MPIVAHYSTGTATVAVNGIAVTGQGTTWLNTIQPGDLFGTHKGIAVRIAAVNSDTSLTLAYGWPGAAQAAAAYEIQITPDAARMDQTTRNLLLMLSDGELEAIAGLNSQQNTMPYFTGQGTAALATLSAYAREILALGDAAAVRGKIGAYPTSGGLINGGVNIAGLLQAAYEVRFTRTTDDVFISIDPTADAAGKKLIVTKFGGGGMSGGMKVDGPLQSVGHFSVSATGIYDYGISGVSGATLYATGRLSVGSPDSFPAVTASRLGSDGGLFDFRKGSTFVGSISVTGTATTYGTGSDYRLKSDVAPLVTFELTTAQFDVLDDALLRVMAMRPVSFRWISAPGDGLQTGFIAHELQQAAPHAVTGQKDADEDIGTATIPERVIPARIELGRMITVLDPATGEPVQMRTPDQEIPEQIIPAEIVENVRQGEVDGADWVRTGTRPAYQTVDHGKITPDLVAAVQSLTLMVLEQRQTIEALSSRVVTLEAAGP